jgi:hypothetical protein
LNDYGDEWDNLQSQVQEYTKKNEINGWKFIIINETNLHISNMTLNIFTNTKEVELYDLTFMNIHQHKKIKKNKTPIFNLFQQVDECIPYEEFSTNMKNFYDEQRLIVDDIIYIYITQISFKTFTHFLNRGCMNRKNFYISVYHTKHFKILYKRHSIY